MVSVLAFNQFGASVPASVHIHQAETVKATERVSAAGPEFTLQPKLYVLAIGISQYDDPALHLTYPGKDARDFVAAMRAQKGRLYRDVVVTVLTDKDATRDAIEDGLDWLKKQTTSNDVAMIFLSGHGSNDPDGNYFFLPVGFNRDHIGSTRLPWTELVSTVKAIAGKVILFNDSCHSGNMAGGGLKGAAPDNTGLINELISAENGGVFFAASTGSEYAREDPALEQRRIHQSPGGRHQRIGGTRSVQAASRSTCFRCTSPSASKTSPKANSTRPPKSRPPCAISPSRWTGRTDSGPSQAVPGRTPYNWHDLCREGME